MKNSYSNIFAFNRKNLNITINHLNNGNIVGLPTETVYGLGEEIGLLFQFADDLLDNKGSKKLVGKPVKKDKKKGKSTLLNLMGENRAYLYANNLKKKILRKIGKHGKKAKELTSTIEFILERNF